MAINYPQRYDDDFINIIKKVIDHVNEHGKTIQDLVADGQLTEEQYANLITTINGLVKSGHIDKSDLTSEFKDEIEGFSAQLAQTVKDVNKKANESEISRLETDLNNKANVSDLSKLTSATPLFASSTSEMEDETRPYVNTVDGMIYLYNSVSSKFENTGYLYSAEGTLPMWKQVNILGNGRYPIVDNANKKLIFPAGSYNNIVYVGEEHYLSAIPIGGVEIDLSAATGSSAWVILLNLSTQEFELKIFREVKQYVGTHAFIATFRIWNDKYYFNMPTPFYVDDKLYGIDYTTNTEVDSKINTAIATLPNSPSTIIQNPLNAFVKAVAHRGYSQDAPENTLPAYQLAKEKGFSYVECDIKWTSDGIPVLLHDSTIDRTSDGTGNVRDFTLAQLKTFDFGSWKNAKYAGTRIPTLEEFLILCKKLNLHPYLETKGLVEVAQAKSLVDLVKKTGMAGRVTWLSFGATSSARILAEDNKARLGLLGDLSQTLITNALNLKNTSENVFINANYTTVTKELAESALLSNLPVEVWTVNDSTLVDGLVEKGVSGITTDYLNIAEILQ